MPAPKDWPNLTRAGEGRKPGARNKASKKLLDFIAELMTSDDYLAHLKERVTRGVAKPVEILFLETLIGKPTVNLDVTDKRGAVVFLPRKDELPGERPFEYPGEGEEEEDE